MLLASDFVKIVYYINKKILEASVFLLSFRSNMEKIDKENLPNHVVVVPDGNRRWAKKKGKTPWQGHLAGAENTEELIRVAFELGIKCFSIWGGSYNNLTKRPKVEIKGLFRLYDRYFLKVAKSKEIHKNQTKVRVIGRWSEVLPTKTKKVIQNLLKSTEKYKKSFLNIFIAYNGTDEMLAAIKGIVREAGNNKNLKVTGKILKKYLWSGNLPPVDLIIRTGSNNDPHNSVGFMMWHTANSQYYFTDTQYPDFNEGEFNKAIKNYIGRQRRFGR